MPDFKWVLSNAIEAAAVRLGPLWPAVRLDVSRQIGHLVECAEYIDEHSSFMSDEQARSMFKLHQQAVQDALLASDSTGAAVAQGALAAIVEAVTSNVPLPLSIFETP
jgi:hypothetical protein